MTGESELRCREDHCITCGDVAIAMTVLAVDRERRLALCQTQSGHRETVETALVDPIQPADRLLVHAGTAIQRLREAVC